jgi:hypothetical protein
MTKKSNDDLYENMRPAFEQFEVVLIRRSANEMSATPASFKRVAVLAPDPLAAMMSEEVRREGKDWRPICATKSGILTDPEVNARRLEMEGPPIDKSKI